MNKWLHHVSIIVVKQFKEKSYCKVRMNDFTDISSHLNVNAYTVAILLII
jgi:hypothetical protein